MKKSKAFIFLVISCIFSSFLIFLLFGERCSYVCGASFTSKLMCHLTPFILSILILALLVNVILSLIILIKKEYTVNQKIVSAVCLVLTIILVSSLILFTLLQPYTFIPEKCELGSGITCMEYSAKNETIKLILNNGRETDIYNLSIHVDGYCKNNATGFLPIAKVKDNQEIYIRCEGLESKCRFKSDLTISYYTLLDNVTKYNEKKGFLILFTQ